MTAAATAARRTWRPPPLIKDRRLRWAVTIGILTYLVLATASIEVNWQRVAEGLERGTAFAGALFTPDFTSRGGDILEGFIESLAMTLIATLIGLVLALPVAVGAAGNLAPRPVYYACRALIAVARSFQEIIIAILFVAMLGFGPLAGVATLAFASIGFIAKLLAEDIEAMDPKPLESIRATGGSAAQTLHWAVLPQVLPRLIGIALYRLDINFRESAIIGIVGAGGIGATLNTAFDRYEYDTAAAILLLIIAIVLAAEYGSGFVRERLR